VFFSSGVPRKMSLARLAPAMRNQIIGMKLAGASKDEVRDKVRRTDVTKPSLRVIHNILSHCEKDCECDGRDSCAGGRQV
jgi:hypothetical protein